MKAGIDYIGVSVGAMIFNDKHDLLLCKRGQKAKNERGCWEIPGGAVEFGETLQEAIKREMKEELNVEVELLEQLPAANHIIPNEHQHWVPTTFLTKVTHGTLTIMEPEKCDAIGWFPLTKLPNPLSIITKIDISWYNKSHHA
jgi:8-oxo-dGTP diphosphatase